MRKLILGLILFFCGNCYAGALSGYSHHFTVTTNHLHIPEDSTEQVLKLRHTDLTTTNLNLMMANIKSDGTDLAITIDGSTKLYRTFISLDTTAKTFELDINWNPSSTNDTIFYVCFGKSAGGDSNSTSTYNSNTKFYLPMTDANDKTSNAINFTVNGATSGQIGKSGNCYSFDGVNDNFSTSYSSAIVNTGSAFTFSVWVNLTDFNNVYPHILNAKANTTYALEFPISNRYDPVPTYLGSNLGSATSWSKLCTNTTSSTFTGDWVYIAVSYNGAGSTTDANFKIYENGILKTKYTAGNYATNNNTTYIGGYLSGQWFKGKIDEVKLMTSQLSDNMVSYYYTNINEPTYIFSVGNVTSSNQSLKGSIIYND